MWDYDIGKSNDFIGKKVRASAFRSALIRDDAVGPELISLTFRAQLDLSPSDGPSVRFSEAGGLRMRSANRAAIVSASKHFLTVIKS